MKGTIIFAIATSDIGYYKVWLCWIILLPNPIVAVKTSAIFRTYYSFQIPLDIVWVDDCLAWDIEVTLQLLRNLSFGHVFGFFIKPGFVTVWVHIPQECGHLESICSSFGLDAVLMEPVANAVRSRKCYAATTSRESGIECGPEVSQFFNVGGLINYQQGQGFRAAGVAWCGGTLNLRSIL